MAVTWSALWNGARAQGGRLVEAGLRLEEPVLLALPTSELFFTTFFGIHAAGAVPAPITTPQSLVASRLEWYREHVARIASDSGARILCTSTRFEPVLRELVAGFERPLLVIAMDAPNDARPIDPSSLSPESLGLLQYTSGSTTHPKGVALTHAGILTNTRIISSAISGPTESGVSWLPLYHDMGLIGGALSALYGRTPVLLMPTPQFIKEPASWLRAIAAFEATITLAPNFAYGHAVRHAPPELLGGISLASLRTALNGAEPVDLESVEAFERTYAPLGLRSGVVRPVYGLAESSLAVTFADAGRRTIDTVDADALEREGIARPGASGRRRLFVSVGRALPTQDVRVFDADDRERAEREIGEIVVRGPSLMRGYYNRPDETAEALRGGWLHTGDLGYLHRGELFITGRAKDLIIRNGRNYHPADIESALAPVAGVLRGGVAAFGYDADGRERVVVVVETKLRDEDARADLSRRIRARCHEAFLFGPDDIALAAAGGIPRTTSGKVRRHECRRLYLAGALTTGRTPATRAPARTTEAPGPS
jgi:acyl-CoA synthetase (AMP-forming)/AMP-acid ligase II